jgi:hypothetical protein
VCHDGLGAASLMKGRQTRDEWSILTRLTQADARILKMVANTEGTRFRQTQLPDPEAFRRFE